MFGHCHVAVVVRSVEKGVACIARLIAVIGDQRAADPVPFVVDVMPQPDVHGLKPVVVMHVVIEAGSSADRRIRRAEPLLQHLPARRVSERVGVSSSPKFK